MKIRVISDVNELRSIEDACLRLFASCACPHISCSYPYVIADAAARAMAGSWRFYAAYQGDELAGYLYGRRRYKYISGVALPVFEILSDPLLRERDGECVLASLIDALQHELGDCFYIVCKYLSPKKFDLIERCLTRMNRRFLWRWAGYGYHVDTSVEESTFLESLDGKRRRELDRRERRLRMERAIDYMCEDRLEPKLHAQRFEEFIALEDSGWKGRQESSIRRRQGFERYYRELVASAARAGLCVWHTLRVDGHPAAMNLCLRSHGTLWLPKVAHDETYARYGPGFLVTHHMLKWCIANHEIREMNNITGAAWTQTWNPVKTHYRSVTFFHETFRSRLAHLGLLMRDAGRKLVGSYSSGYDAPCL